MAFFCKKKCQNCDFSTFWSLSVCFSANFQQLGMELVSNVYLWPTLPSPGNNSTFNLHHAFCCGSLGALWLASTQVCSRVYVSFLRPYLTYFNKLLFFCKLKKKLFLPMDSKAIRTWLNLCAIQTRYNFCIKFAKTLLLKNFSMFSRKKKTWPAVLH